MTNPNFDDWWTSDNAPDIRPLIRKFDTKRAHLLHDFAEKCYTAGGWQPAASAPKNPPGKLVGPWIVGIGTLDYVPEMLRGVITRWCTPHQPPVYAEGWAYSAPGYQSTFNLLFWMPIHESFRIDETSWKSAGPIWIPDPGA